jgi:hypothetical protein
MGPANRTRRIMIIPRRRAMTSIMDTPVKVEQDRYGAV